MSFPLSTFGMNPDDIRYLHCDSYVQGKGRDRLKYLDLEGRWVLSGRSIPYISATFNHLEKLNYAKGAIFDITEPALDAIGLIGWTPEQRPKEEKKKPFVLKRPPVVEVVEEVQSPREPVPHRSAGYGPAHHKRKLSVPDRSRSPSASSRDGSPIPPEFDKYATRYQRKVSQSVQEHMVIQLTSIHHEIDDDLPPPPTFLSSPLPPPMPLLTFKHEPKAKAAEKIEDSFTKFKEEVQEFDRSKLRKVPTKKMPPLVQLSLRERLHQELLSFNWKHLKHVETRKGVMPVVDPVKEKTFEELYVVIPLGKMIDEGCQTDLEPAFTSFSDKDQNTATFISEPDSGIDLDEAFEWQLFEEHVSLIRIEETEYYLED